MENGKHEISSSVYEDVLNRHYRSNPGNRGKPNFRDIAIGLAKITPEIISILKKTGVDIPDDVVDVAKIILGKFDLV